VLARPAATTSSARPGTTFSSRFSVPKRYHCRILKPFDNYEKDSVQVLSENGYNLMQSKKPGFLELVQEEHEDGKVFDKNGKPVKAPAEAEKPKS
jgi:hypothetical protein